MPRISIGICAPSCATSSIVAGLEARAERLSKPHRLSAYPPSPTPPLSLSARHVSFGASRQKRSNLSHSFDSFPSTSLILWIYRLIAASVFMPRPFCVADLRARSEFHPLPDLRQWAIRNSSEWCLLRRLRTGLARSHHRRRGTLRNSEP